MQKIKNEVLDRLLKAGLSRAEVDFIIYISHYQDDCGRVMGLYYKDVCSALKISYQTFYDVLENLQEKGIICVHKAFYADWDVTITGNQFKDGYSGYVSTGDDIFADKSFRGCKAEEKLLAMEFLKIVKNPQNGGKYRIGRSKFIEKYCRLFHVTKRILLRYLKRLKQFFSIGLKDGIYFIRLKKEYAGKENGKKDKELLKEHISGAVFRRHKVDCADSGRCDTAGLLGQYAAQIKEELFRKFEEAVAESIRLRNQGIKNKYKWNRRLNPKFVHKILQEKLSAD